MKHLANSAVAKRAKIEKQLLKFFAFILELRLQTYSAHIKRYPPKKFFKTLNVIFQAEFPEKGAGLRKLD